MKEGILEVVPGIIGVLKELQDIAIQKPVPNPQVDSLKRQMKALEGILENISKAALESESKKSEEYAPSVIDCIDKILALTGGDTHPELVKYFKTFEDYLRRCKARVEKAQGLNPRVEGAVTAMQVREVQLYGTFHKVAEETDQELGRLSGVDAIPQDSRKKLMELLRDSVKMQKRTEGMKTGSGSLADDYVALYAREVELQIRINRALTTLDIAPIDEEAIRRPFDDEMVETKIIPANRKTVENHGAGMDQSTDKKGKVAKANEMEVDKLADELGPIKKRAEAAVQEAKAKARDEAINARPDLTALRDELNEVKGLKRTVLETLQIVINTVGKVGEVLKHVGIVDGGRGGNPDRLGNTQIIDLLKLIKIDDAILEAEKLPNVGPGSTNIEHIIGQLGKGPLVMKLAKIMEELDRAEKEPKASAPSAADNKAQPKPGTGGGTAEAKAVEPEVEEDDPNATKHPGYTGAAPEAQVNDDSTAEDDAEGDDLLDQDELPRDDEEVDGEATDDGEDIEGPEDEVEGDEDMEGPEEEVVGDEDEEEAPPAAKKTDEAPKN